MNEEVVKRIQRSNGIQSRDGNCLICGKGFEDCPHSLQEVKDVVWAYNYMKGLMK